MTNECAICFQPIPDNRSLCEGCENDLAAEHAGEVERLFRERQARAACVE